jgi:tetratricopeptide (TPR) repeat protein
MTTYSRCKTTLTRVLGAFACAAALSACSTAPVAVPAAPKLADLLSQGTQHAATGKKEQAVTVWKQAATAFPADKTPWVSIAQTRYESGQYGEAIQAAQEVLLRDPNDKLANSIIAISGLRLSTRALADLSRQSNLAGPIKTESQDLARILRETLGDTVLVPPAASAPPVRAARNTPARSNSTTKNNSKQDKDDDASANPFQTLK